MDFLDDPFADPVGFKGPTTGRFKPKAKPIPKKGPSVSVLAAQEPHVSSLPPHCIHSIDSVVNNIDAPRSSSLTEGEYGNLSDEAWEVSGSAVSDHPEIARLSTTATETPTLDASSIQTEEELPDFSNVSFTDASILPPCNVHTSPDQSVAKTFQESFVCDNGEFQIDVGQLDSEDFSCLETVDIMNEAAASIEKKAIKFKPKPKAQKDRQKDPAKAVSHLPHAPKHPSENQHLMSDDSIHARESDTISDLLHTRLDGKFSLDSSVFQLDNVVFQDADSLIPEDFSQQSEENHGEGNSNDLLDSSVKSVDESLFSGVEGNENGCEKLDGINGGFYDNICSYDRAPDELASNRNENHDGDNLGEETSQKKRARKSKKVPAENNKPARKRKKAAEELDVTTEKPPKPPKKFPRATRRKRCVDKALLEVPEDELDLQRVPIRDLIILAEYKERQAKKEPAAVRLPATESVDNVFQEDPPYGDNETFGFDQDGDTYDNPSKSDVQKETGYYNYQSFMTKEPRARWTKQDTELFYQGLSQFGSDLSMIQQLFPGRTRHQIKLKYKKEERQSPMRLHDALTSRAQDHSHFEFVIQRLQEQAARDAMIDYDDSVCAAGEDEGPVEVLNTHEDGANSKQNEDSRAVHQDPYTHKVESPPKFHHSDEEEFDWNSYKSVF